jgi:hypothetical protein
MSYYIYIGKMSGRAFGGKVAGEFRTIGAKLTASHAVTGSKWTGHHGKGPGFVSAPHATGLGSLNNGEFHAGNTHNAVANGLNDKRPNTYQAANTGTNQLERATKKTKGGIV